MTANDFRTLALSLPEATEESHQDHPDFRVGDKIFATLGYPDKNWGMVKLTPNDQESFVRKEPEVFVRIKGAWGLRGATNVFLKRARKASVRKALAAAWRNTAPESLKKQSDV